MLSTQREGLKPMAMQANNICFALFIAAAILGIVELPYSGRFGLGFEMVSIAKNLADTGRFANPIRMLDTGYTAANPPLYPLFLAVLFKVFGSPTSVAFAALMANVVANALTASWLPRVSLLFFGDLMPGVVASVLWMASVQVMPSWDMDFTVAGLILFCLIAPVGLKPESGIVSGFGVGALAGLLFLLNPSSLLVWLPWVGYLLFRRKAAVRQTLVATLTVSLFFFAWGGRNYLRLGAFVMRTNLGQTLYASNNDCAQSSMAADNLSDCYGANHPNESLSEARLMRSMGEVRYDRLRTRDAKMWIAEHPARFRQLTLQRIREFWFPAVFWDPSLELHPYQTCAVWLVTALSIPGLVLMIWRREAIAIYVLAVLLIYPLMYYLVVSDVRYRFPVLWLSLLPAGYLVWRVCCYSFVPSRN
jgi:hypothetical protein